MDVNSESVQVDIQQVFDANIILDDSVFRDFLGASCKLNLEVVSMIFVDGTVGAVLSAYAVPIKLKYERPPSSKFGKDPPLWKTATSCFLNIVREIAPQINVLGSSMIHFDVYGI